MANDKESKLTQALFTTFLALNIVLISANLYTMYHRRNGDKKCKCKQQEQG